MLFFCRYFYEIIKHMGYYISCVRDTEVWVVSEGYCPSLRMVFVLFPFLDHASPGLVGRLIF